MPLKDPVARAAYQRKWVAENREKVRGQARDWYARNSEQVKAYQRGSRSQRKEYHRAHEAVAYALRMGRLECGPCEDADDSCCGQIQAHHDDYSKPLDVRWLCKAHHTAVHLDTASQAVLS